MARNFVEPLQVVWYAVQSLSKYVADVRVEERRMECTFHRNYTYACPHQVRRDARRGRAILRFSKLLLGTLA